MSRFRALPRVSCVVAFLCIAACSADAASVCAPPPAVAAEEERRQAFHYSPPTGWMNDPNGLVYADGEYHLFYQHNPESITWGNLHWGHAVSPDLLRWVDLPVAITPNDELGLAFSGSAVIDERNTSGLCAREPCMVAIYTHSGGADGSQKQSVAVSDDAGRTFTEYEDNPVLPNPGDLPDFRDPRVFRHDNRWIMALAAGDRALFYASEDLLEWTELSAYGPIDAPDFPDWTWEVVDIFPLDANGEVRWVLKTDLLSGPLGSTTGRYWVGTFDGTSFTRAEGQPPGGRRFDGGADFYAAMSYNGLEPDEATWIGWQASWAYALNVPTSPWRGSMSVPRVLRLVEGDDGFVLSQTPVGVDDAREECPLVDLSDEPSLAAVASALERVSGDILDIELGIRVIEGQGGIAVRTNESGERTEILYDADTLELQVDRRRSGESIANDAFRTVHRLPTRPQALVEMRILVDRTSVEVFVDDGRAVISSLIFPATDSRGLELIGGPDMRVDHVRIHRMREVR